MKTAGSLAFKFNLYFVALHLVYSLSPSLVSCIFIYIERMRERNQHQRHVKQKFKGLYLHCGE